MVEISFSLPSDLGRNLLINRQMHAVAEFVRDLWLARSPYSSGAYVKGLSHPGSIKITHDRIIVRNMCPHAEYVEYGHGAFNIGMAMLNNGRNVKMSATGNRYKTVVIPPRSEGRTRSARVAGKVTQSFRKMAPMGMNPPKVDKYGKMKRYVARKSLKNPLKSRMSGEETILTISEKSIKEDPSRWRIPAIDGRYLAQEVRREALPYVENAIKQAFLAEKERQERQKGKAPTWYKPGLLRKIVR